MDQLAAIRVFLRVVETQNFSLVAREFRVAQSTVSKQIAALETHLGAQLLVRNSRRLSLTEAGQDYYKASVALLSELNATESRVGKRQSLPSGTLRITVSPGFGRLYVVPLLDAFLARYPDIAVDFVVSDHFLDLIHEGLDVAVRIGELRDSGLIARRIGSSPRRLIASDRYLKQHGEPVSPDDLINHNCIAFTFQSAVQDWHLIGPNGSMKTIAPKGSFRANDAESLRQAVLCGLGIALPPVWLFAAELELGIVRTVMNSYATIDLPIHALHAATRQIPTKVRVFVDFLAEAFSRISVLKQL